jgi:hypothetical protein
VAPSDPRAQHRYFLSRSRFRDTALTKGQVAPVHEVRLARIPFDDEGDVAVSAKLHKGLQRIVSRVGSNQKGFSGHLAGALKHLGKKAHKSILGMLAAFPKFDSQAPAFVSQVSANGRVSVVIVVGSRNPFFLGSRVVQAEDIQIQGNMAGGKRRYRNFGPLKHFRAALPRKALKNLSVTIEPLSLSSDTQIYAIRRHLFLRTWPRANAKVFSLLVSTSLIFATSRCTRMKCFLPGA